MGINYAVILQVAVFGLIVAVLHTILEKSGREEYAQVLVLLGVIVVMFTVIRWMNDLFSTIRAMFQF
ncbi:MAG TPA: stage III sporulation protein AC [Firmicutes bacterium]|jgi:stage III sporulation protein AC|nr:stage III sporulation protein AC [Bacillota bacterium]